MVEKKRLRSTENDIEINNDNDNDNDQVNNDDDDDDDVGPMPLPPSGSGSGLNDSDELGGKDLESDGEKRASKKKRHLPHESIYLSNLPNTDMYERSLMHRDIINFVEMAPKTDFLMTTSLDGHIKFWKKTEKGIEFVKHYRGHLGAVVAVATSADGRLFATAGADKAIKIFDVVNFGNLSSFFLN
jgi:peptidylprolyl isomerase domain and WD repeat-containing protein 1